MQSVTLFALAVFLFIVKPTFADSPAYKVGIICVPEYFEIRNSADRADEPLFPFNTIFHHFEDGNKTYYCKTYDIKIEIRSDVTRQGRSIASATVWQHNKKVTNIGITNDYNYSPTPYFGYLRFKNNYSTSEGGEWSIQECSTYEPEGNKNLCVVARYDKHDEYPFDAPINGELLDFIYAYNERKLKEK